MRVAVIGTGRMGRGFATAPAPGHELERLVGMMLFVRLGLLRVLSP